MADYEPFCPPVQRLGRRYRFMKWGSATVLLVGSFWAFEGRALYRRLVVGLDTVAESRRTGRGFVAVSFPRLTASPERFALSKADLDSILDKLAAAGWKTIGLRDVEDFYERDRPLPPKALFLTFERDEPASVQIADEALERHRMRGLLFLNKTIYPDVPQPQRPDLTPHAVTQLRKSGAWDFGWVSETAPVWRSGDPIRPAVLDLGEEKYAWTRNPYRFPVRLIASRSGYNDAARVPWALRVLRPRPDKTTPDDVARLLNAELPRNEAFADDFKKDGLGLDWIAERGVVVVIGGRMVVIPTPKQKSASVYLSGTDEWRDCVVEWELRKYRRDAWLYARGSEQEDRWVRVGARDGYWYVQQKLGGVKKPVTIARAPMNIATLLPARLQLVLKGDWAILTVNGRMQFGKAVRLHPGLDAGRVELDVYSDEPGKALGVFGSFAAWPLSPRWVAVSRELAARTPEEGQQLLDEVRRSAVISTALSPRWLDVQEDGSLAPTDEDRELVRNLAGYYRCALVPMVDFATPRARLPADHAAADKVLDALLSSLDGSEAEGLNLRLSPGRSGGEATAYLLSRLRVRLHEGRRRLYITVDGPARGEPWLREADVLLRAVGQPVPGAAILEPFGGKA